MIRKYLNHPSKFNNQPFVEVKNENYRVETGWEAICAKLNHEIDTLLGSKKIVVVETYQGVIHEELLPELNNGLNHTRFIRAEDYMLPEEEIKKLVFPDVTNDRVFGFLTRLTIDTFFDPKKVKAIQDEINAAREDSICGLWKWCRISFP
jgi:hypothetical protein